jgi:hypothetical protein
MSHHNVQRKKRITAEQSLYNLQQGKTKKPDVYGTRKRLVRNLAKQRDQYQETDEFDSLEDITEIDSDTISAADYLIKSNPKSVIPICFVHQIYSILPNNTIVDRELVSSSP